MENPQAVEEDLQVLENKINQLKREYEQYFLGTRPREPVLLIGEVRKTMARLTNTAFQNTALKFKFSSICSRYQAFNRQWQENLRKIEQGTYERHRFKANLHERERGGGARRTSGAGAGPDRDAIFAAYIEARQACGQGTESLTPAKLDAVLAKQERVLRDRYGADAQIRFQVVVEDGRAKLKATRTAA